MVQGLDSDLLRSETLPAFQTQYIVVYHRVVEGASTKEMPTVA